VPQISSGPVVRSAAIDDIVVVGELIRAVAEFEKLLDQVKWSLDELRDSLFGPDAIPRVLLAELDGEPAGLAIWFPTYSTFLARPGIWLEDLFVPPRFRGRGVARALLQHLFALADGGRVEWAVLDWNVDAIAFYESTGARAVTGWTTYRRDP